MADEKVDHKAALALKDLESVSSLSPARIELLKLPKLQLHLVSSISFTGMLRFEL